MFNINKKFLIYVVIISLMPLIFSGCGKKQKEGIIAKVNGDVITQEEFDEEFEITKKIHQKKYGEDILSREVEGNKVYEDVLKEDILNMLVNEKIIAKEIEDINISITNEEIEEAIRIHYIDELGGEEKYEEFLKNNDFTEETIKRSLKRQLMYEKHKEDFFNKTKLSEKEIKECFNKSKDSFIKVRVSHILVPTEGEGDKILKRLKKGQDFHSLAATKSMDASSASKGGDLGYITKGFLSEVYRELENEAFKLEVGEISGLVKTDLGYHIILVEDRKDTYEDLKEDIIPVLKYKKHNEAISRLKEKANIQIYMEDKEKTK